MKKNLSLYSALLGTLMSLAAVQAYAGDVASVSVASYSDTTAMRAVKLERATLREVFHAPAFNVVDQLREFSGRDWRGLTPLGRTVPHELREATPSAKAAAAFEETARAGLY